ncbi:hypothetical protein AB205_0120310, partial [Aquarana catesbeiana]
MMTNCSQVEIPMRTASMHMSFPEMVSDSLCRNSLVMQTDCCRSCPGGWSQTILEVRCTAKFSETPLEMAYGREMNIQFKNSSGGHSCSQHANCMLPQNLRPLCGIVLCDKTAHFRVAFYCGQPKAHLCNNHAV